jgi:predicted PurR-regulated permease PerM
MPSVHTSIKYVFFVILAYLFFLIIQPFLPAIVMALVFAVAFFPLLKYFQKKLKMKKGLATSIIFILTFLFIIGPLALLLGLIVKETVAFAVSPDLQTLIEFIRGIEYIDIFGTRIELGVVQAALVGGLGNIAGIAGWVGANAFSTILSYSFQFFVFLFLYLFLLLDGEDFLHYSKKIFPFTKNQNEIFFKKFSHVARTVFQGNLLAALLSGVSAMIAFTFFGIQAALIWGILAGILSLVPTIGTLVIYGIAALVMSVTSPFPWMFVPLVYYLVVEIGLIQSFIKPKLIDEKIKIHPVFIFLSLVGGISVFGSIGMIYGPLIVVLFITMFDFIVVTENK